MNRRSGWRSVAQASALLGAVALLACATGAGSPQSGASQSDGQNSEISGQTSAASNDPSATSPSGSTNSASSAPTSKRRPCAGGECSVCGPGVCALGMFCVEGKDGAGCSWLPDCGSNDQCGCINKHLGSGCHCEQADKAVRVRCD
ncbi:MAG TPA: hypothetical protein VL137_00825 [Polyangiaceae bacterium]|nr:hypothetical protein [Polyangiaceae bacterium]